MSTPLIKDARHPDFDAEDPRHKYDNMTQLDRIECKLDEMLTNTSNVQTLVEKVVAEVKPTLDALMQSPLFKMLGMKK